MDVLNETSPSNATVFSFSTAPFTDVFNGTSPPDTTVFTFSTALFTEAFTEQVTNGTVPNGTTVPLLFKDYPRVVLNTGFAFLVMFSIFGVFANAISMLALGRSSKLTNATTALLMNLCFSDILFSGTSTPFAVTVFWYGDWVYPHHICVVYGITRFFNVGASIFTVMAISINRLVIISYPTRYKQIFSVGNNLLFVTATWLLTLALLILPTGSIWGRFAWDAAIGTCSVVPYRGRSSKAFLFMFAYFVPTVVFVVCYSRIYYVVRRTRQNLKRYDSGRRKPTEFVADLTRRIGELNKQEAEKQRKRSDEKDMRLLRMVLVIFVTFTMCYLPLLVLKAFRLLDDYPGVQVFAYLTFYFSGCVNPIIYICMSREYRKSYFDLFRRVQGATLSDTTGSRETPLTRTTEL
ncbi:G-protein coupled receptor moody-like [Ornithodoros turicata]|uniref:G-protein coupled receptor moody-like n=1 Tax=Ornithodoros turicata TaxID=34597 RepID=UPI00313903A1